MNRNTRRLHHVGSLAALALWLLPASSSLGVAGDDIALPFPGRAEDLAAGEVWYTGGYHSSGQPLCSGGPCAHDLSGQRRDGDSWTPNKDGAVGTGPDTRVIFGKPVYAGLDGEVIACWQHYPDHPTASVTYANCMCNVNTGQSNCAIAQGGPWVPCNNVMRDGGNAVVIMGTDGNAISYNHLKSGSVPDGVCPNNPSQPFPNSTSSPNGAFPDEYVPDEPRPLVRRGDPIGQVGHSGQSSGPHLHIQATAYTSNGSGNFDYFEARELAFTEAWVEDIPPDGVHAWTPLEQDVLNPIIGVSGSLMFWPDPLNKRTGEWQSATTATEVVSATRQNGGVTAARAASNELALMSWEVEADGELDMQDEDASSGAASMIAIASLGSTRDVITAVRTSGGALKVITWDVSNAGTITRVDDVELGSVSAIAIAPAPAQVGLGALTAVRNGTNNIQVDSWSVNAATLALDDEDGSSGGVVSKVAIAAIGEGRLPGEVGAFTGAVTASIGAGILQVRTWKVGNDWSVTYTDYAGDVAASEVAVAVIDDEPGDRQLAVTAIRDGNGNLRLTAWEIDEDGNIFRGDADEDGFAGAISKVSLSGTRANDLLAGVRTGAGWLELMTWNVDVDARLRRGGTIDGVGTINAVDVDAANSGAAGPDFTVTSLRTGTNLIKLIAWPTHLDPEP